MKKKVLPIIVVIFMSVGWFIYRALHVPTEKVVETDSDSKVITFDSKLPPSLKINTPASSPTPKAPEEKKNYRIRETKDEQFEAFDKLDSAWLYKAKEIIGADKYAQYLEMRNRNDREKMQAYKEYHDYLRQKYGDKFSYNITDDQSIREKQINQRYLKDLLKLIGPDKFKKYTAVKDQFNEEMRRSNKESIQIEF
ncbi:MAG: hypothetical protein H7281_05530 [Bacteriovorax sp.]|nr:hypothetical protein [Bacteriovorax sp.]